MGSFLLAQLFFTSGVTDPQGRHSGSPTPPSETENIEYSSEYCPHKDVHVLRSMLPLHDEKVCRRDQVKDLEMGDYSALSGWALDVITRGAYRGRQESQNKEAT